MGININYNTKLSYLLSFVVLILVFFWFIFSDEILVFKPKGLFEFNLEEYNLNISFRFAIGLFLSLLIPSLSYTILRENKLFEGDISVLYLSLSIIIAAFPQIIIQIEWLLISILLLVSLRTLSSVHNQINIIKEASILGIFSGILVFFEPILILLVIPNLIGMALLRSFQLKESLFFLVNLFVLFFWILTIFHLLDIDYSVDYYYKFKLRDMENRIVMTLFFPLQAFILLKAFLSSSKMVIRKKNQVKLFFGFLISIIILLLFLPLPVILSLLVFPFILLFAIFFQAQKHQGITSFLLFAVALFFILINLF